MLVDEILTDQTFCDFLIPVCNQDKWDRMDMYTWILELVQLKVPEARTNDFHNKLYEKYDLKNPKPKDELIKLALVSDFHVDYQYEVGKDSDCGKPLCCRGDSGVNKDPSKNALKWGNFACDTPIITLESMLDYVKNDVKPDAILWGGDSIPHDLDTLRIDSSAQIMKNVTKVVSETWDEYKIIPCIGNHDTYPQDIIKFHDKRSNENINMWSNTWTQFIDDEDEQNRWLDWGYFKAPLVSKDGTKLGTNGNTMVFSLNTNLCYLNNFEVFTMFQDPGGMLTWLENELKVLQNSNGTAIILGHVPNGDECTRQFSERLKGITDRFQTVIRWGMYSHEH